MKGKYEIPKFIKANAKDLINKILEITPRKRYKIE